MQDPATRRGAILGKWLERTVATYPLQTSRFLRNEKDRFRNPVGHTLREGLAVLLDQITGEMDAATTRAALEDIVRLRAVQDFSPGQATGFIFLLREILCEELAEGVPPVWQKRIDETALLAFDLYVRCREEIVEIKAREAQRGFYVRDRMRQREGGEGT
jgi:hypothetical protein